MMLIPWSWLIRALAGNSFWAEAGITAAAFPDVTPGSLGASLIPVTLGDILNGALVGVAYWFAYLREPAKAG